MSRVNSEPDDDIAYLEDCNELDESSDPFVILSRREEEAGVPLFFMITNQETH